MKEVPAIKTTSDCAYRVCDDEALFANVRNCAMYDFST